MTARSCLSLVACTALLGASPLPPPLAVQGGDAASPVRCRTVTPQEMPSPVRSGLRRVPGVAIAPPPGPPPPPPPPPPAPPAPGAPLAPSASIVVTSARMMAPAPYGTPGNTERYAGQAVAAVRDVAATPVSTFSVDVDTGSYANVRRFLTTGQPVPAEAVRTEEMLNYFRYDYPRGSGDTPFAIATDVARTPWNANSRLIRIGLRADAAAATARAPANLVFLVDTSGSMDSPDKLPLVKTALAGLAGQLRPDDRIAIIAYAGSAGIVLEPTTDKRFVRAALDCLQAGGSTAGGQGIELAYATARAHFRPGAVNRVFLATDGDFNVGLSDNSQLEALVKRNRDDGITLTTLGFGTGNYNEAMMERIADVGNGNYAYVDSADEARKVLADELAATLVTVAKDVKVQVEFNPAAIAQYRLIGYENRALRDEDFTNDAVDAGDIGAGHQVTALYEVMPVGSPGWTPAKRYPGNRPTASATGGGEACYVKLRYKLPDGTTSREVSRVVPIAALRDARAPAGDMAFVAAVAAYGQKLRGDALLGDYSFAQIGRLSGDQRDYWRQGFGRLVALAGDAQAKVATGKN
jgi:Ca-activated chloride channel family protein